jgi:FdhE protein
MTLSTWQARIERAAELEKEYLAVADVLRFYRKIAAFQKALAERTSETETTAEISWSPKDLERLLVLVQREGPTALAEAARNLERAGEPMQTFFGRVLRQPFAGLAAAQADVPAGSVRKTCPFCGERPAAVVLRPEGDGARRSLMCSLCFTEWEFRRLLCPNCGEEDHTKLPVYKAAEFPHLRAEACDSCARYINAVDLTVNGLAIPEVDELVAIPLDLWVQEKGYVKLQVNILGM